jgi:hypothetical protein
VRDTNMSALTAVPAIAAVVIEPEILRRMMASLCLQTRAAAGFL